MRILVAVGAIIVVAWALGALVSDGSWTRPSEARHEHASSRGVPAGAVDVSVVRIVDGDTLVVRSGRRVSGVVSSGETRVRLLEVDTPESVAPGMPVECYGERATEELTRLVPPGSTVRVLPDRDLIDPYGRTLLYVWNARGQFVNLELVRSGPPRPCCTSRTTATSRSCAAPKHVRGPPARVSGGAADAACGRSVPNLGFAPWPPRGAG